VGATPKLKTTILHAALSDELEQTSLNRGHEKPSKRLLKGTGMSVDLRTKQQAHHMVKGLRKEVAAWQKRNDAARIIKMYWAACIAQGSAGCLARARVRQKFRTNRRLDGSLDGSKPELLTTPLKTPGIDDELRSTCKEVCLYTISKHRPQPKAFNFEPIAYSPHEE
jgi:hypothetical protein